MDNKLAKDLLFVFDTPKNVETFQTYVDEEIKRVFLQLKGASDPVQIYRFQGQITALENMRRIRDNALNIVKGK